LQFSRCYRFLTPEIAGYHLEETVMRNVLLSALMISLYALSSTMDFVDAERLRASHKEAKASVTRSSAAQACASKQQLAMSAP
jgi:uncharacterized membrane protein (DUF106 family)